MWRMPCCPIVARDVEDLLARRADAREMRRGCKRRGLLDARDDVVRASARRAVGTVGHGNESRLQSSQPLHRLPTASAPSPRPSAGRTRRTPSGVRAAGWLQRRFGPRFFRSSCSYPVWVGLQPDAASPTCRSGFSPTPSLRRASATSRCASSVSTGCTRRHSRPARANQFTQRRNGIRRARRRQRVEVFDDHGAPAILQRAGDLAERRGRASRRRQHAIDRYGVEQRPGKRQVVHVAALQLAVTEPGAIHVRARPAAAHCSKCRSRLRA